MSSLASSLLFVQNEVERKITRGKFYQDFPNPSEFLEWLSEIMGPSLSEISDEIDWFDDGSGEISELETERDELQAQIKALEVERDALKNELEKLKTLSAKVDVPFAKKSESCA